jgi:hypothetical protein
MSEEKINIDTLLGEGFADQLKGTLEEVNKDKEKVAIPMEMFRDNFIDYFTGDKEDPEFNQKWIAWVGGPDVPANLVHNGELIYTIEPIVKKLKYKDYDKEKYEPGYVIDQCKNLAPVNPQLARQKMVEAVKQWVHLHDIESIYQDSIGWNKVLAFCDKPTLNLIPLKYAVYLQRKNAGVDIDEEEFADVIKYGMDVPQDKQVSPSGDDDDDDLDYGEF